MATAAVTNTFANDTNADATEVNANFSDLVTFLNGSVIHKDASVAFTGVPSGPATDPTTAIHLTRKAYVDALVAAETTARAAMIESGTYTPVLGSMAVGTGGSAANSAIYSAVDCGTYWAVTASGRIVFGTTSATLPAGSFEKIGVEPTGFSLAGAYGDLHPIGTAVLYDTSAALGYMGILTTDGATVSLWVAETSTYTGLKSPAAAIPFTWAAGDVIEWSAQFLATK